MAQTNNQTAVSAPEKLHKVHIKVTKEQFVPAEFSLLQTWAPILEREASKSTLVYLQLQTGINRDEDNENYGYSWISREEIMKRCKISKDHFSKCMKVLTKHGLVVAKRRGQGKTNLYTIPDLPPPPNVDKLTRSPEKRTSRNPGRRSSKSLDLRTQNKEKEINKNNVNVSSKFPKNVDNLDEDIAIKEDIVRQILEVTGDPKSLKFYRKIASTCPEEVIYAALSETRYLDKTGQIKKNAGACFTDLVKRSTKKAGIKL